MTIHFDDALQSCAKKIFVFLSVERSKFQFGLYGLACDDNKQLLRNPLVKISYCIMMNTDSKMLCISFQTDLFICIQAQILRNEHISWAKICGSGAVLLWPTSAAVVQEYQ